MTSVQQIVENIRSGEIVALSRSDIGAGRTDTLRAAVTLPLAESAWQRLRDYETWLGYMYGWVYPENVVNPLVLELVDPDTDNTPLTIRQRYLYLALEQIPGVSGFISAAILNQLKDGAKTESLAPWKATVDAQSTQAELTLGARIETPYEALTAAEFRFILSAVRGQGAQPVRVLCRSA